MPIPDAPPSLSQRAADRVAKTVGSWRFIILQSTLLIGWVILNVTPWVPHWDPYPFILMNLFLSLQAAYTAPMIMMSQNRQSESDRNILRNDYEIDRLSERQIREMLVEQREQRILLEETRRILEDMRNDVFR